MLVFTERGETGNVDEIIQVRSCAKLWVVGGKYKMLHFLLIHIPIQFIILSFYLCFTILI